MSDGPEILKYFAYSHLPAKLQEVSKPIGELAFGLTHTLPPGPELSAGLRKLLEAKDCFVRAALALLLVALLGACSWTSNDINVNQAQGLTQPSGPSPSPGAPCEVGSLRPGTAGDVREIAQGATVAIGVELLGAQGLPLASSCLGQYSPAWTGGAPCLISGAGYDVALSAPLSAPLDAVCSASVSVGGKSGSVSLRVVP